MKNNYFEAKREQKMIFLPIFCFFEPYEGVKAGYMPRLGASEGEKSGDSHMMEYRDMGMFLLLIFR